MTDSERDRFIAYQVHYLDEMFALAPGEDAARQDFEALALETYDCLSAAGEYVAAFKIETESAFFFLRYSESARAAVPPALLERWKNWERDYPDLLARNPRLALHDMMHEIAESDCASSWPCGLEEEIQDWIDGGDIEKIPFQDRYAVVTRDFFERLQDLRQQIGGWLYFDDARNRVVFVPETEWQRIRTVNAEKRTAERKRREELMAKGKRVGARLDEILSLAREDTKFWKALIAWERDREFKAYKRKATPTDTSDRSVGSGWTMAGKTIPKKQRKSDYPPADPIFAEFLERVHGTSDEPTVAEIVVHLRRNVRKQLGFDESFWW